MDPISSTQLWSGVGAVCITLVGAITVLFKTLNSAQERREKALEDRAKEDRDKCASAYSDVATRLREIEDRSHKEAISANREMVSALKESIATNRELSECARETVKASGRCARVLELVSQSYGIQMAAKNPDSAARKDESSQEFIIRDPVEKFTTTRPGKAV